MGPGRTSGQDHTSVSAVPFMRMEVDPNAADLRSTLKVLLKGPKFLEERGDRVWVRMIIYVG
jgi:hypothetical protein